MSSLSLRFHLADPAFDAANVALLMSHLVSTAPLRTVGEFLNLRCWTTRC